MQSAERKKTANQEYTAKLTSRSESEANTFHDKQKQRKFNTNRESNKKY